MVQLLALLAAVGFVNLLFVGLQVVAFKVARFPVDQLGFGLPFLLKRRVNGVDLKIGPVPILAFVYSTVWKDASRVKRALTAIAPWLVIGALSLALVGPARGLRLQLLTWPRLVTGALDTERAHSLIGALWQLLGAVTPESVGVVMALIVVLNLSPCAGLAGGHVLFALLGMRPEDRAGVVFATVSFVLGLAIGVSWLVKLLTFLSQ